MKVEDIGLDVAQTWNSAAWVLHNNIVNENGVPLTFKRHRFMAAPYMDDTPEQVIKKCGQVGWSTLAILRALHLAKYKKANIAYTLPSKSVVSDFVAPKVDPLIQNNRSIAESMGHTDSKALKSIRTDDGERFIYFRGSWEPESAISISIHVLINDEVDRSNPKTLETFRTRLDAARLDRPDLGWVWMFSNPSLPGRGVDEGYQKSDQKHWMIKCSRCNKFQYLDWPDNIDIEREMFICKHCKRQLSEDDRATGNWVKKKFGRDMSGYWISQLMAPWFSAKDIIKKSQQDASIFHNFVLGKAYVTKEDALTREIIAQCCYPDRNPQTNVAMGVDVGVTKHYVIGNEYGIFRVGETDSWQEIEQLRNFYNAALVCDANPHPTPVKKLVDKYRGKVWMCYYKDTKDTSIINWGEGEKAGVVYADRTKIIDSIVADFRSKDQLFNMTLTELDNADYIKHWLNMYRIVEENSRGVQRVVWTHDEGKPEHYAHATGYFKMALQKTMITGEVVTSPSPNQEDKPVTILPGNKMENELDLNELVNAADDKPRSWKNI